MDKRRLAAFRRRLESKRDELDSFISKTQSASLALARKKRSDEGEEASISYNRDMLYSQGSSGRSMLAMVTDALARLDNREFGICEECGSSIGLKRLDAVPWTRYCRDCQEEVERGSEPASER